MKTLAFRLAGSGRHGHRLHAIQGFTEALRCELMHDGSNVRVTMVQLPAVNTPQSGEAD